MKIFVEEKEEHRQYAHFPCPDPAKNSGSWNGDGGDINFEGETFLDSHSGLRCYSVLRLSLLQHNKL